MSAHGALRSLAAEGVLRTAHRGRGYPAGAHTGAAGAARRLPCGARHRVAPHNSLRSRRSLRSDRSGESDHEARTACAPTLYLRSSALPKSPLPGIPCREAHRSLPIDGAPPPVPSRCGVAARRPVGAAEHRSSGAGARSALRDLTRGRLSERSERSERSEFGRAALLREAQGRARTQTVRWTVCAWRGAGPLARRGLQDALAQRGQDSGLTGGHPAAASRRCSNARALGSRTTARRRLPTGRAPR